MHHAETRIEAILRHSELSRDFIPEFGSHTLFLSRSQSRTVGDFYSMHHAETRIQALLRHSEIDTDETSLIPEFESHTLFLSRSQSRRVGYFYSEHGGNEMHHAVTRIQALLRHSELSRERY